MVPKRLFPFLLLALFFSCKNTPAATDEGTVENDSTVVLTEAQYTNSGIVTGQAEQLSVAATIKVNGKIGVPTQNIVSVVAPLGGYLKTAKLLPGTTVVKGQVIATLEDPQYVQLQQDYLTAKSKLHFAKLELNRQKILNQAQAGSDKVMQQAQNEMNQQQIIMNGLAEQLKIINIQPTKLTANSITGRINIYAPITGTISRVNVNLGKYVAATDILFEIINASSIHLELVVFEKDIRKIFIGQQVTAYSNVDPEKKYPCKVQLINKDVTPEGYTKVICSFFNSDPALLPGMYMNADIQSAYKNVIAVPEDALVSFQGKLYIFEVIGNKTYLMKEVQTGTTENAHTVLLNEDEVQNKTIVLKGAYTLLMKLKNKEE